MLAASELLITNYLKNQSKAECFFISGNEDCIVLQYSVVEVVYSSARVNIGLRLNFHKKCLDIEKLLI